MLSILTPFANQVRRRRNVRHWRLDVGSIGHRLSDWSISRVVSLSILFDPPQPGVSHAGHSRI